MPRTARPRVYKTVRRHFSLAIVLLVQSFPHCVRTNIIILRPKENIETHYTRDGLHRTGVENVVVVVLFVRTTSIDVLYELCGNNLRAVRTVKRHTHADRTKGRVRTDALLICNRFVPVTTSRRRASANGPASSPYDSDERAVSTTDKTRTR